MSDRTVTLSDGSVWEYVEFAPLAGGVENQYRWVRVGKDGRRGAHLLYEPTGPLVKTANDYRAIAEVLDPRENPPAASLPAPEGTPRVELGASEKFGEERYYCGCRRLATWDRCTMHTALAHDEEPPSPLPAPPAGATPDCWMVERQPGRACYFATWQAAAEYAVNTIPVIPLYRSPVLASPQNESERDATRKLVHAVEAFLTEVRNDTGDPWNEPPTQDILKDYHPIQKALADVRSSAPRASEGE